MAPEAISRSPGLETGPQLCAELAMFDPHDADDDGLLALLTAEYRQLAYQQARVWAVMSEMAHRDPMPNRPPGTRWSADEPFESAVDEVRARLLLTRRSAQSEVATADSVAASPRVFAALRAGEIDRRRAMVLTDGCWGLTDEQATAVLDDLLGDAGTMTATELEAKVKRLGMALDPAWAERRYKQAVRERKVVGYLNADGSATVSGQNLPADQAASAYSRVDALADAAKRAGAAAKIDHLRAEIFLSLLDGSFDGMAEQAMIAALLRRFPKQSASNSSDATKARMATGLAELAPADSAPIESPSAEPAPTSQTGAEGFAGQACGVHVRVSLTTLLGLTDEPGELPGWGPVDADTAREIIRRQHGAEWRYAIIDADGYPLFDGILRRRPSLPTDRRSVPRRRDHGLVELHVPIALVTERDHGGTCLDRSGADWTPVLNDLASQYARKEPIAQDPFARFPGRRLRRRIQINIQRCVFPGCRRPAVSCDLDHHFDYARGGRTEERNLGPGCGRDHELKTSRGWRLIRRSERAYVWISPFGGRYLVNIEPVAPPVRAPIPRALPPDRLAVLDDVDDPPDDHDDLNGRSPRQLRDRRGRLVLPADAATGSNAYFLGGAQDTTGDPPPF